MLLANTINVLNDKGIKYKVMQDGENLTIVFGLIANGNKSRVQIVPGETEINVNVLETEKNVNEEGLSVFLDTILELKAIQEQENQLIEALKA